MVIIYKGQLYLDKRHIEELKMEPEYVQKRYQAVASVLIPGANISIRKAASRVGLKRRQFSNIIERFKRMGIVGLRRGSRRPHHIPKKTPLWIEDIVTKVRERSGFGSYDLAAIINCSLELSGKTHRLNRTTVYRILVRKGIIEAERRAKAQWKRFEWGHPNRLIQADLTYFNGYPLLTTEDDHSRKGWALRIPNATDKCVVRGMKRLLKMRYDNLLTDNGAQFSRKNRVMKEYCEEYLNEKHIWTSLHHPQTLGKLSAFQKALKRFLFHTVGLSTDKNLIDHYISVFSHWYNNGRYHRGIENYPEVRYSGKRDEKWYSEIVKGLKLQDVLTVP